MHSIMQSIIVIGIGAGNPDHMTIQAIEALNRLDLILIPRKPGQKDDLAEVRREICRRFLTNPHTRHVEFDLPLRAQRDDAYLQTVDDWHDAIADAYGGLLAQEALQQEARQREAGRQEGGHQEDGEGARVGLLVWGDPSLYDSTLRIIDRLRARASKGFALEVIPGVTSIQTLAASHQIPLNTIGGPVLLTTGRRLRQGAPDDADTIVVMLDGDCAFTTLPAERYDIWWGAYLGMAQEVLVAGALAEVSARIVALRAQARARHGWIMDSYLLRRRP